MTGRRLYVYGVTADAWAKRHGIEAITHSCSACGAPLTTSMPFVAGQLRGLDSPTCECGNERTPYVVVRDAKHGGLLDRTTG